MKQTMILALVAAAALAACGGGGDSATLAASGGTPVPPPAVRDQINAASLATAAATGLTVIAAAADEEAYDVAADIGDTWRITFNTRTGAYTINVLSTQFALQSKTGVAVRTVNGNFVTYTANAPVPFVLVIDTRTKTISGNITLGERATTVAGTGYTAPDLSKLAGIYSYFGSQRNASDGLSGEFLAGQLRIAANGATAIICDGGTINASDTCTRVGARAVSRETLTLTKNLTTQLIDVKINGNNFGVLNVKAGDLGPVLLLDRFGFDASGKGTVLKVGGIYAVKPSRLAGTEMNGTFACSSHGEDAFTVAITGTSASITSSSSSSGATGSVTRDVLAYNQLAVADQILAFDGAVTSRTPGEAIGEATNILPLSSSLVVVEGDHATGLCRKTS